MASLLTVLMNDCTDSSKLQIFTKFKLEVKWKSLVLASTKKKGRATSPIRQIPYKYM